MGKLGNIFANILEVIFNTSVMTYEKNRGKLEAEYESLSRMDYSDESKFQEIQKRKQEIEKIHEYFNNPEVYDTADEIINQLKGE